MKSAMTAKQREDETDITTERGWSHLLTGHLPLETETVWFLIVSVLDFLMTYEMLSSGRFRESNRVAEYFLNHWGPFKGMLYFKMILVAVVCVIAQIVALKKEHVGRWILNLGTIVTGAVVVYSLRMYLLVAV